MFIESKYKQRGEAYMLIYRHWGLAEGLHVLESFQLSGAFLALHGVGALLLGAGVLLLGAGTGALSLSIGALSFGIGVGAFLLGAISLDIDALSFGMGHLVSMVELAKLLIARDDRISVTILIMTLPSDPLGSNYTKSLSSSSSSARIRFVHLPPLLEQPSPNSIDFFIGFVEAHKPLVRDAVFQLTRSDSNPTRLAGFVVDMCCTIMIEVASEFGVPSYVFSPSGAVCLDHFLHTQRLHYEGNVDLVELAKSGGELKQASLLNPLPAKLWPSVVTHKVAGPRFLFNNVQRFFKAKGILINTFEELESHALESFYNGAIESPPVYPVGPILGPANNNRSSNQYGDIMSWLDDQPPSSVVFLSFGSMGSFDEDQIREIARGLELINQRFLWSLRRPPPKDQEGIVTADYENIEEILPEGFLDRTAKIGKVIGWAPQVDVLAHKAVGGFVSHCGWNSILESIWNGVPIATWPLYAEQQMNAFELVKELGLAVEISLEYMSDSLFNARGKSDLVKAEEIQNAIGKLMDVNGGDGYKVRRKVKDMRDKCRKAVMDGGSSHTALSRFIENLVSHLA
ncbi:UDP-glucuronosyl/UDP-glucosyltransferase [Dillenia turbinata]|uniref:Glycosyltransferase n=1 Tax=Dillenia turbinata TaxID=194707 RepID=A0AAN8YYF4_9MAGN